MTRLRVLVGASIRIEAESWMQRQLQLAIPANSIVIDFGGNEHLSRVLEELNPKPETSDKPVQKKRITLDALDSINHLFLFWDGRTLTDLLFEARLRNIPTKVLPFKTTVVVNKDRESEYDVYVGRGTPWGNPFHVGTQDGQFDRKDAIEKFKEHFEKNMLSNESIYRGMLGLRGKKIACHCKPLACHGDVIASYLNSMDPDEIDVRHELPMKPTPR